MISFLYMLKRESFTWVRLSRFIDEKLSGVIGKFLIFYAEVFSKLISVFFDSQYMVDLPPFFEVFKVAFYDLIEIKITG